MEQQAPAVQTTPNLATHVNATEIPEPNPETRKKKWWDSKPLLAGIVVTLVILTGFIGYGVIQLMQPASSGDTTNTPPPVAMDPANSDEDVDNDNGNVAIPPSEVDGGADPLPKVDTPSLDSFEEVSSTIEGWKKYSHPEYSTYSENQALDFEPNPSSIDPENPFLSYVYMQSNGIKRTEFSPFTYLPGDLEDAIAKAFADKPGDIFTGDFFRVDDTRIEGDWAIASVFKVYYNSNDEKPQGGGPDPFWITAKQINGEWQAGIQGTDLYNTLSLEAPDNLVSPSRKESIQNNTETYPI